jgi:hypothetical protein
VLLLRVKYPVWTSTVIGGLRRQAMSQLSLPLHGDLLCHMKCGDLQQIYDEALNDCVLCKAAMDSLSTHKDFLLRSHATNPWLRISESQFASLMLTAWQCRPDADILFRTYFASEILRHDCSRAVPRAPAVWKTSVNDLGVRVRHLSSPDETEVLDAQLSHTEQAIEPTTGPASDCSGRSQKMKTYVQGTTGQVDPEIRDQ